MAIEWDRLGQPLFDRHVEALLYRLFDGVDGTVTAVNGRGGDQGIDVRVDRPTGLRIFQLKYFPEGFSGPYVKRRSQITKSFRTAMQHRPVEWTLVVPCTLSPSEQAFLRKLPGPRDTVKVTAMGRAALDSRFAAHPDLEASFKRDLLREAARDFNQEQALLLDPGDLVDRVRALGDRADGIDPHWAWDFRREGAAVYSMLRAKHPLAHVASPITLRVTTRPGAITGDLDAAITRTLGFGIVEEVRLPAAVVESLTIDGPAWIAGTVASPEVVWTPAPSPSAARAGDPVDVTFQNADGSAAALYRGRLRALGAGGLGASIDADVHGGRLQVLLPADVTAAAQLRFNFDLEGCEPSEGMKLLGLYLRLLRGGAFNVTVDGAPAGAGTLEPSGTAEDLRIAEQARMYLSDLDVIQRHCETYFPAPLDIPAAQRVHVRIARLIIEGHCTIYPFLRDITFTLSGGDHPTLQALLSGPPACVRASPPDFDITVGEHTLNIGPVHLFHTQLTPDNGPRLLTAVQAGRGAGRKVTLRPANDAHFRIYHGSHSADDQPLEPTPLGLDGGAEPA